MSGHTPAVLNAHAVNPDRIRQARLAANMSRADLAYEIRRVTKESIRATERSVSRWENRANAPSDGVVPAIAAATGKPIKFFYGNGEAKVDDDEESDPVATLMTALLEVARNAARAEIAAQTQEASA